MSEYVIISTYRAGQKIVDPATGAPTTDHLRQLNDNLRNLKVAISQVSTQADDIEASLIQAGIALTTAEAAAAAVLAQSEESKLVTSYTSPCGILTASDGGDSTTTTITVADHDRVYGDGLTVAVTGGTVTGLNPSTVYYVVYQDADYVGGTVTYQVTTDPSLAGQGNGQHACGDVTTPSIGGAPVGGSGPLPPGVRGGSYDPNFVEP